MWIFKTKKIEPIVQAVKEKAIGFFTSDGIEVNKRAKITELIKNTFQRDVTLDLATNVGQDSTYDIKTAGAYERGTIPDALMFWYSAQSFIGYNACSILSQHWLIDKACTVPAREAVRKGWEITVNDGNEVDPDIIAELRKLEKKYKVVSNLVEFVKFGRVFGVRIAMFKVESTDPDYYTKPFNIDGITPGSYKGISQIDPYWVAPELDSQAAGDPSAINFYEPTYWVISGLRVHKSHLIIMRSSEVPDLLKPTYFYGGLSIPQKIYERVYGAERTANEAPNLTMSKRTNTLKVDMTAALADQVSFI